MKGDHDAVPEAQRAGAEDIAPQYTMGLGDYTGVELRCYLDDDEDKTQFVDVDTRNWIVKFDDEDGNEYIASEVEAIVGAGLVGRRNEVDSIHIKWRGYGDEYNTWQSLAEFLDDIDTNDATHVRELLQAFMIENNARLRAQDEQRLFPNGRE